MSSNKIKKIPPKGNCQLKIMPDYQSFNVIGFHSCDLEIGLKLLNGQDELQRSENTWDWLGPGIYCFSFIQST